MVASQAAVVAQSIQFIVVRLAWHSQQGFAEP
jgi:hypothetical protein